MSDGHAFKARRVFERLDNSRKKHFDETSHRFSEIQREPWRREAGETRDFLRRAPRLFPTELMAACYGASITVITRFRAAVEPVAGELVNQNDGDRNARVASSIACDFKRSTDRVARGVPGKRDGAAGRLRREKSGNARL